MNRICEMRRESLKNDFTNQFHSFIHALLHMPIKMPIEIERGRYTQIPSEFRLCILCDSNSIEDEKHFLFECIFYDDIRLAYSCTLEERCKEFITLPYQDKLKFLMSDGVVKSTADFVYKCFKNRRNFIYN